MVFSVIFVQAVIVMAEKKTRALPLLCLFVLLIFGCSAWKGWPQKINFHKAWFVVQLLSIGVMLFEIFHMELKLSWDWQVVITTAWQYAMGDVEQVNQTYFATYPNNQFWTACLTLIFKVLKKMWPLTDLRQFKWVSMLLGGVMTQTTLWLIYETARLRFQEGKAFFIGCFAAFFLPVYLYAKLSYTDVPGMLLAALLLYVYERKAPGRIKEILLGILAAFTLKIKVTVFIIFISILLAKLLDSREWKKWLIDVAVMLLSLLVTFGILGQVNKLVFDISPDLVEAHEFPKTHWVMMGLKGKGGYSNKDVKYTKKFSGIEAKKDANLKMIRSRIKKYGASGLAQHILVRKLRYTWCNSCLAGDYYGTKYPYEETKVWHLLSVNGKYHWIALLYSWPYYILVLLGLVSSGLFALRKSENNSFSFLCRLSLLGLFLFLAIWECNSRYLVSFIPVLIPVSGEGICVLVCDMKERVKNVGDKLSKSRQERERRLNL